jgi:hypothetical protein
VASRILNIVETAYRATLEEQDDPVLWLSASLRGNGADVDVLLRGSAVNYLVRDQDASGLSFGGRKQTQPPRLPEDVASLIAKGSRVFYVEEDVANRGIVRSELIEGPHGLSQRALPKLLEGYEHVWNW